MGNSNGEGGLSRQNGIKWSTTKTQRWVGESEFSGQVCTCTFPGASASSNLKFLKYDFFNHRKNDYDWCYFIGNKTIVWGHGGKPCNNRVLFL